MGNEEKTVPAFGGKLCGKWFHCQSDPPFGYREQNVMYRGASRKVFVYNQLKPELVVDSILRNAVRQLGTCCDE